MTDKSFEYLSEHVKRQRIPNEIKRKVILELDWLRLQSLCDPDRQYPAAIIQRRWRDLCDVAAKFRLFDKAKQNPDVWDPIMSFVGERHAGRLTMLVPSNGKRPLEVDQFFRELLSKLTQTKGASPLERLALYCGLKYLESEAKRGRTQRDRKSILPVWKGIHPLLKSQNLLAAYENDEPTIQRIKFFLSYR